MRYLISLLIPPLGILLTGRIILALIVLVLWGGSALILTPLFIPIHVLFVIVAWVIIAQAKGDKRHKQIIEEMRR